MKKTVRLSALLLALGLLCPMLFSCGNTEAPANTDTPVSSAVSLDESTEPVETAPQFPAADYQGDDFVIYARKATNYYYRHIISDNVNGDVVNDAVYSRNQDLKDKYNINIKVLEKTSPYSTLLQDINAGDLPYDIVLDQRNTLGSVVTNGVLYNLNYLDIDYSRPWWDENCAEGYAIGDKLYFFVNDVTTVNLDYARFLFWSKQLIEDYKLKSPYEYIDENKWTLENFVTLVQSISDLRTDGTLGTYGIIIETGESNGNNMHFFTGCGLKFTDIDAEGKLVCTLENDIEKVQKITDILKSALVSGTYGLTYDENSKAASASGYMGYPDKWTLGRGMFSNGHYLFVQGGINLCDELKEMPTDYGVAPNPKYNEDQTDYYHKIDKFSLIWAVPNSDSVDTDRIAVIMDFWAYDSSEKLIPAYYETTIKAKRVSDPKAQQLLDIIRHSVLYELSDLFCTEINACVNSIYNTGAAASMLRANKNVINNRLKTFNQSLEELD